MSVRPARDKKDTNSSLPFVLNLKHNTVRDERSNEGASLPAALACHFEEEKVVSHVAPLGCGLKKVGPHDALAETHHANDHHDDDHHDDDHHDDDHHDDTLASFSSLTFKGKASVAPATEATEGKIPRNIKNVRQERRMELERRDGLPLILRQEAEKAKAAERKANKPKKVVRMEVDEQSEMIRLLSLGGLRFVYVSNIETGLQGDDGYLVAVNGPTGKPLSNAQQKEYVTAVVMAANLPGFKENMWPFWWPDACLMNTRVQEVLKNNGFVKFVNFHFEDESNGIKITPEMSVWAIEYANAQQRRIVGDEWITLTTDDKDWVKGKVGPVVVNDADIFLASSALMDDRNDDRNVPGESAVIDPAEYQANQEYFAERNAMLDSAGVSPEVADQAIIVPSHYALQLAGIIEEFIEAEDVKEMVEDGAKHDVYAALVLNDESYPELAQSPVQLAAKAQLVAKAHSAKIPNLPLSDYYSIVNWYSSNGYMLWKNQLLGDDLSIAQRAASKWHGMYRPITPNYFITKTDAWPEGSKGYELMMENDGFIKTDIVSKEKCEKSNVLDNLHGTVPGARFAVQADDSNQHGFFSMRILNTIYQKMFVEGKVMYSVAQGTPDKPGKAIQFIPDKYICSNAFWWRSKLAYLPTTQYLKYMNRGSFNSTQRLMLNVPKVITTLAVIIGPRLKTQADLEQTIRNRIDKFVVVPRLWDSVLLQTVEAKGSRKGEQLITVIMGCHENNLEALLKFVHSMTLNVTSATNWIGVLVQKVIDKAYIMTTPDPRVWLPNFRIAYGLRQNDAGISEMLKRSRKNGLVLRSGYIKATERFGFERPMREMMLSCLASANGFGPRIFATWITPKDSHIMALKMNEGDEFSHYGDGMATPKRGDATSHFYDHQKMIPLLTQTWWTSSWIPGNPKDISDIQSGYIKPIDPLASDYLNAVRIKTSWQSTWMLMEGFDGDLNRLRATGEKQQNLLVAKVYEQCERMSQAGLLHGDIKPGNAVYRAWHNDDPDDIMGSPWNRLEVRFIDFDPLYCKLVPFIPTEVLLLINFTLFMSFVRCFGDSGWLPYAWTKISSLLKTINDKYSNDDAPFAHAFRVLKPFYGNEGNAYNGPKDMVDPMYPDQRKPNPRFPPAAMDLDDRTFQLLNDEFEAARAFRFHVENYFEKSWRKCSYYNQEVDDPNMPTLVRLLSYIAQGDQKLAEKIAPNGDDRGKMKAPEWRE